MIKNGMKKLLNILCIFLSFSMLLSSCMVHRNKTNKNSSQIKEIAYKTVECRSECIFRDQFNEQNFTAHIRIQKDQKIWISLTGPLSIEGARLLITPDTVSLIDRINKKFYTGSYSAFQTKYKIPISYFDIQKILVGDFNIDSKRDNCLIQDELQICTQKNDSVIYTFYSNPKNYTIEKIRVKDRFSNRNLDITFAGYQIISGNQFSFNKNFEIYTNNEIAKLQMDFTKVEYNKTLEFSFSIPETYEKLDF